MFVDLLIVTFCFLLSTIETVDQPIVETTHGKVAGKILETLLYEVEYYGFMGIPYAAPPVNDLKFLPPQSVNPWDGILQATKEKQACIQFNTNIRKGQRFGHYGVEDCLYLDIFTPALDKKKRAIIIFIYNEQFKTSYNKTKDYNPDFFIEEDIVIVTISYRLSVFGFLSFEDEILSGNSGLKDIVSGLEWTKNNIEQFGGDPNRITMMGSRGGASAVDLLVHSKAKDLFNSVILQSGTSWASPFLHENARQRAFKLAETFDMISSNSERVLKYLNEIEAKDLLAKELRVFPGDHFKENQRGLLAFGPIVERIEGLLTEYPENLSEKIKIPIMIGFNSREGLESALQYLIEPKYLSFLEKDFPLLMPLRLNFTFDPLKNGFYDAVNDIKKFYFKRGKVTIKSIDEYLTYAGDLFTYAIDYTARIYCNRSLNSIYYYHFDYYSDFNENKNDILKMSTVSEGTWGAATGDELCYLFKCPASKDKYLKHNQTMSVDIIFLKKLVKMWGNFAKYGNPTPEDDNPLEDLQWPSYSVDTKEYLNIGKEIQVKRDINKKRFQFWEKFIGKWEQQAVNGIVSEAKNKRDEL